MTLSGGHGAGRGGANCEERAPRLGPPAERRSALLPSRDSGAATGAESCGSGWSAGACHVTDIDGCYETEVRSGVSDREKIFLTHLSSCAG